MHFLQDTGNCQQMYFGLHCLGRVFEYTNLLGAHEEQMLYSMSHPRGVLWIAEVSHVDIHGRTGLVGFRIVNEEDLKLVAGQNDYPVLPVIERGFFKTFCNPFYWLSVFAKRATQRIGRLRWG